MLEILYVSRQNLQNRFKKLPLTDIKLEHLEIGDKRNIPRIIFVDGDEYWQKKILIGNSPDPKDPS
jgi:hypothetical protein